MIISLQFVLLKKSTEVPITSSSIFVDRKELFSSNEMTQQDLIAPTNPNFYGPTEEGSLVVRLDKDFKLWICFKLNFRLRLMF